MPFETLDLKGTRSINSRQIGEFFECFSPLSVCSVLSQRLIEADTSIPVLYKGGYEKEFHDYLPLDDDNEQGDLVFFTINMNLELFK